MALILQLNEKQLLYLGSANDAANLNYLKQKQINLIINCAKECHNIYEQELKYLKLELDDAVILEQQFKQIIAFLLANRVGNIMIHSSLGQHRSVLALIGVLHILSGIKVIDVYKALQIKKPDIQITKQQIQLLEELDDKQILNAFQDEYIQNTLQKSILSQLKSDSICSFLCKQCRVGIFTSIELQHGLQQKCSNYYIERPIHIDEYEMDGKIYCQNQKCKAKVGDFTFMGTKCSCGEWIQPAYIYHKSKIDKKTQ